MERMLDLPWENAEWRGVCICKDAPADMVVALGSHYQRLFVIPSLKAIIVRQGSGGDFSDAQFLRLVLGLGTPLASGEANRFPYRLTCSLVWRTITDYERTLSRTNRRLLKIQHKWAEARIKGDSSYTRRIEAEDCTIVWPDGTIVNKSADLQTMTGDIVFSEFEDQRCSGALYGDTGIVVGEGTIKRTRKSKISLAENSCGRIRL